MTHPTHILIVSLSIVAGSLWAILFGIDYGPSLHGYVLLLILEGYSFVGAVIGLVLGVAGTYYQRAIDAEF